MKNVSEVLQLLEKCRYQHVSLRRQVRKKHRIHVHGEHEAIEPSLTFDGMPDWIRASLEEAGLARPTPIQMQASLLYLRYRCACLTRSWYKIILA